MTTRAQVETLLFKRAGTLMSFVGMAVTYAGANADLADPIGFAVRYCGVTVDDPTSPTSAEITSVDSEEFDMMLDIAEYRLLVNIWGNMDEVNVNVAGQSESYSDIRNGLETRIEKLSDKLEKMYGFGTGGAGAEMGTITLDIADHNEPLIVDEDE